MAAVKHTPRLPLSLRLGRRRLRRFVLPLAIGLVVSVVLLSAAASYRNTQSLFENVRGVRQTHVVLERIEALVSVVQDAEAGQRGFVITGDASYLDSYRRARQQVEPHLAELGRLIAGNPDQEARRASLAALIEQRITLLDDTIRTFEAQGFPAAQQQIRAGAGKQLMESIRGLAAEMEKSGRALIAERGSAMTSSYRAALATPLLAILLGLGIVALAFYLLQRDTARRARAARAVRGSEERYRSLVAATTAIVAVADGEGRFDTPQPSWEAYTGQPFSEHGGYGYIEAVHPEDRESAALAWARAREEGTLFQYEARLRHAPSGTYRYCVARVVPVFNDDGSVREWVSSIIDNDERRRAEMQLAASEAGWRLIFESARDFAIFTLDLEGRVTRWNAGATRLLRYEEAEIIGQPGALLFTPEDRVELVPEREMENALRAGRADNERWHERKDGARFWGSGSMMPLENERGETTGFVKILRDMTAHRKAEEERDQLLALAERARREAEQANEAKDSFLATLSHELRAPLQGAMGWVTLLGSGRLSPDQHAKAVSTLERGIRHQAQLVNDLLDVSRIISGKLNLEPTAVDLGLILEQVREEFLLAAQNKRVELVVMATDDNATVKGDAERLSQIFRNLVANAVKFTDAGGSVRISVETDDHMLVVKVSDTGQGIPAEFLPRIFDRFSQADSSTTRQHGGLGLGLGIVRHLVELHGGSVSAESRGPGQGATFEVRLPLLPREVQRLGRAAPIAERRRLAPDLQRVRVCVVEDDRDTLDAVTLILEQAGAQVTPSSGARAALHELLTATPDVLVTDLSMPGEDGFWLAKQVRAAGLGIPIVALTGFASADTRARVLSCGFQAHVAKPVEVQDLVSTIRGLVGREMSSGARRQPAGS